MFRPFLAAAMAAVMAPFAWGQTTVLSPSAELFLPQYVVTGNLTASGLQSAFQLSLAGMPANTLLRYSPAGSTNPALNTVNGPGFYFGITPGGTDGLIDGYTSNKNLTGNLLSGNEFTNGSRRSELTTSASGTYTGWFSLVPDDNATFAPGNDVYAYVQHNNGSGNQITQSIRTASTLRVLDPTNGTGTARVVKGVIPGVGPEQFVLLYDNLAGAGRPIWASWTEDDGITTNMTTWYNSAIAGIDGNGDRFGAYIPTSLVGGIQCVQVRDADGNLVANYTSADGVWHDWFNGGFVDTKLVSPGTSPLFFAVVPVPEPSLLAALAGFGLLALRRRLR